MTARPDLGRPASPPTTAKRWTSRSRLPTTEFTSRPWRIHAVADDFTVEDVWALPTFGRADELDRLVRGFTSGDEDESSLTYRALFAARWAIGRALGWDRVDEGLGGRVATIRNRLPVDLRDGPRGPDFATVPFRAVYQTDTEYVAELANRTVHALMHIGWVPTDDRPDTYRGVMTALVRPNGALGRAYMTAIKPVRRAIVYPQLLRAMGREWPHY
jgi:hypothetical protein